MPQKRIDILRPGAVKIMNADSLRKCHGRHLDFPLMFIQEFEEELLEAYTSGSLSTDTSETVWSFTGSLFYVGTVFTTVGKF